MEPFIMLWASKHREEKRRKKRENRVEVANGLIVAKHILGFKTRKKMKQLKPKLKVELMLKYGWS